MNGARFARAMGLATFPLLADVVTHPLPPGAPPSTEYRVVAGGQSVAVETAPTLDAPFAGKAWDDRGPYTFANVASDGPGDVRVTSTSRRSRPDAVIRAARPGVRTRWEADGTLVVSLLGPRNLSIEPEGKKRPLLLFAKAPEPNPPKPGGPGVICFGPGVHRPGRIVATNGQTLGLAAGVAVKGGALAQGDNGRRAGLGLLDSSDCERRKGPTPQVVSIRGTNP